MLQKRLFGCVGDTKDSTLQRIPLGQSRNKLSDEAYAAVCSCLDLCLDTEISPF